MKTTTYIQRRSPTWRNLHIDLISGSPIARWAPLPLRLIVGYGFIEHGFAKLSRGLDAFPVILQAHGVPAGFETDLLYLACLAALVLGGSGPLAIDGLLAKR